MCSRGGLAQHRHRLAVEEDDRAQVDVELHVQALGLDVGNAGTDADAGVVDEHVEAAVALAVRLDDTLDLLLIGDVRGDRVHVEALGDQALRSAVELLGAPRCDSQGIALFAENLGDGQADTAGCSGDDRCARC